MVVQHNLTAMNSNRMLGLTTSSQAKSTEKLSSGYKINRAADDAAGLAISEKMRKQIRGLTQASANAQDGISAVQTAEGALTEVHDMLQRMNELAVKAANGTMSENDRSYVQSEIDQLVTEIDRVATTTKFNETYLLKGNNGGSVGYLTYDTAKNALANANNTDLAKIGGTVGSVYASLGQPKAVGSYTGTGIKIGSTTYVYCTSASAGDIKKANTGSDKVFGTLEEMMNAIKSDLGEDIKSVSSVVTGGVLQLKFEAFADLNDAMDVSLHVGADSSDDNKITMNIAMMSARGLGINGLQVSGSTYDLATDAIDTIAEAIQRVSTQRSALGAIQNRLEHTINNLDNVVENTTSAESQIRDTDMATQMVQYSNNNILAQAGQAMLAQANQTNQGVLSLLG